MVVHANIYGATIARRRNELGTAPEPPRYLPPPPAAPSASPMKERIEHIVGQIRKPDGSLVTTRILIGR